MKESKLDNRLVQSLPLPQSKIFRHDINGLRAWAVVAVVLYHFGVPGFAGGFIGVDVFFVISGFLMTGIIISGLERGDFSLWGFYLARARRIIPALLVLCASLLILGWFWLPNVDYKMLAAHVGTAVAFVSNLKFWKEAGYFDATSHDKWLLHTWSLSVEWQFYILLPLGCLLLWHWFGKRGVKLALISVGVLSFVLSVYGSSRWPEAAFYLLPSRAWEMLAGGLVWWATRQHVISPQLARLAEGIGFALIILAIITFEPTMQWPGYLALVPVVGAMLVLAANRQRSWLTANRLARQLGASSYSIYLWHWPFVVLLSYVGEQANSQLMVLGILGSILFGELSLRCVENPTRKGLSKSRLFGQSCQLVVVTGVVGFAAVLIFTGFKINSPILINRLAPEISFIADESSHKNPRQAFCHLSPSTGIESPLCEFGSGEVKVVVVGDSHANAIITALPVAVDGKAIELTYSGCSTVLGIKRKPVNGEIYQCSDFVDKAISTINGSLKRLNVVIVNRSSTPLIGANEAGANYGIPTVYFDKPYDKPNDQLNSQYGSALIKTMCAIDNPSRVYLMRPIPEMGINVPQTMVRALMVGKDIPSISISLEEYHARHKVVWAAQDAAAAQCGVKILDPLPYLCDEGRCWGSRDGKPIYYDDDHLSEYGNKLLVPMFKEALTKDTANSA